MDVDQSTGICDKDASSAVLQKGVNALFVVDNSKSECDCTCISAADDTLTDVVIQPFLQTAQLDLSRAIL